MIDKDSTYMITGDNVLNIVNALQDNFTVRQTKQVHQVIKLFVSSLDLAWNDSDLVDNNEKEK